jgi:hypothetical protein
MSPATPSLRALALALAVTLGLAAGGLRPALAQVAPTFTAALTGSQEVPANSIRANGTVTAELDGMTLTVSGTFSGLESDFNTDVGAHLHLGLAGENGPVAIPLVPTLDSDGRGGSFDAEENVFELTSDQLAALQARRMYVNVHTIDLPAGEIRGQLVASEDAFFAPLSGASEVPANASRALGGAIAELDGTTLTVSGTFSGLESDFATDIGAHLHLGLAGENGPVTLPLEVTLEADLRGGAFAAADNTFELSSDQVTALQDRRLYVNVHSVNLPAGEIRGQLAPAGAVRLAAALSGRAEVPANGSQATGYTLVELTQDGVVVTGAFSGLQSNFNTAIGAHLHLGAIGVNGPVEVPLVVDVSEDRRSGRFVAMENTFSISEDQAEALASGRMYVNVHTEALPAGEVRGQVVSAGTRVFEAWLVGTNEVPAVTTVASGGVIALLNGSELTVAGAFRSLGTPFDTDIGAHIHLGAADENGPVEFPLETELSDEDRSGTFSAEANTFDLSDDQREALFEGRFYVNVHSEGNPAGEVRGQLLVSTNLAPRLPEITAPPAGATVVLSGDAETPFVAEWTGSDPNANPTFYTWELATAAEFGEDDVVLSVQTGMDARFETTFETVDGLLAELGVGMDDTVEVFHRVRATDGSFARFSEPASVMLTRAGGVSAEDGATAITFGLHGAAPNPMRGAATLSFSLPEAADVRVEVFDPLGRRVAVLPLGERPAGTAQTAPLSASGLASGVYLVRLQAVTPTATLSETTRVTVVR